VAWTTPRTWVALEVVAAADLNTVRDNLTYLKGDKNWQLPTLLNSWVAYDTIYGGPRYKLVGKLCVMIGLAKSGTVSTVVATGKIFTLDSGYRPATRQVFGVASNAAFGRCDVLPTGEVVAYGGSNVWFSVAGIVFPVA
jgi:hypothetical protein